MRCWVCKDVTLSEREMVVEDGKVGKVGNLEKKYKKSNKNASTSGIGVAKADVKAVESDLSFKETKRSAVKAKNDRDEAKMETKSAGEGENCDAKRKRERKVGNQPGNSSKDSGRDGEKNVEKKKYNKFKKISRDEQEMMHDALLDTSIIAHASASETWGNEKVVSPGKGSGGNAVYEGRKRRKREKENKEDVGHSSGDRTHEKSEKRVKFSGHVQVYSLSSDEKGEVEEENLLRGKRFSDEEDEIVKAAVYKYIEMYNLGEEGLTIVLNSKNNPKVKGCWKAIGSAIPYRPYSAVYFRAQILFRRGENRKWTEEEYEIIRKQKQHGRSWASLAVELGKHQTHVRKTWLRIKSPWKKGHWTQEEYQHLFDLVNTDLQLKLSEEKKSRHGMLRDNIRWTAISDKLSTRIYTKCCEKWYNQLSSPMVASGEWADTDDYRLVDALFELDASCMEDVDWDNLLDHRSGELCRKRWNQMVLHIGQHGNKSFAEQVEVLAKRYRPDLVEAREAWDGKPVVP